MQSSDASRSEALSVEIRHISQDIEELRASIKELRQEIKEVRNELSQVNLFVNESKLGRKWLFAMLSASAVLGGLIDLIMRALKLY